MILGIDPSLTATGFVALSDSGALTYHGTMPLDRKIKGNGRLHELATDLDDALALLQAIGHAKPSLAVLEDLPMTAHSAGKTGMAQGVVRAFLSGQQIPMLTVAPATLKKAATGSGRADKKEMLAAAQKANLDEVAPLRDDNQIDGWWLAQIGRFYQGKSHHLHTFGDQLMSKIKVEV